MSRKDSTGRILVAHVIYRFAVGGLENGLVNIINRLPSDRFKHLIISLTDISDFKDRLEVDDVECIALNKPPGNDPRMLWRLFRIFRSYRPDVVHTRNLAALEAQLPAWLAGVQQRIHGEHGRDVGDLHGTNRKYMLIRRMYRPFVKRYVPLSRDLGEYLRSRVGVPSRRITLICNGVDADRFSPGEGAADLLPPGFVVPGVRVVGTVGRLESVKDQLTLVKAFIRLCETAKDADRLRLVIVGEGSLRSHIEKLLQNFPRSAQVCLAGDQSNVPEFMRLFDVFVLPSLAEGISNTILEAMACGLPVVATDVGGNHELVVDGETGALVPSDDAAAMADAIGRYTGDAGLAARHGEAARRRIEETFSIRAMVQQYQALYLARHEGDDPGVSNPGAPVGS